MFSSYIRELTWSPGHSFILRYVLLESLPVRGSFAVQFGDHLRACTVPMIKILVSLSSVLNNLLSIIVPTLSYKTHKAIFQS